MLGDPDQLLRHLIGGASVIRAILDVDLDIGHRCLSDLLAIKHRGGAVFGSNVVVRRR